MYVSLWKCLILLSCHAETLNILYCHSFFMINKEGGIEVRFQENISCWPFMDAQWGQILKPLDYRVFPSQSCPKHNLRPILEFPPPFQTKMLWDCGDFVMATDADRQMKIFFTAPRAPFH